MPSNKDQLYLGLYARAESAKMPGKEDTYVRSYITIESHADDPAQIPLGLIGRTEERKQRPAAGRRHEVPHERVSKINRPEFRIQI